MPCVHGYAYIRYMNINKISEGDFVCGVNKYADEIIIIQGEVTIVNVESNQVSIDVMSPDGHIVKRVAIISADGIIAHKTTY